MVVPDNSKYEKKPFCDRFTKPSTVLFNGHCFTVLRVPPMFGRLQLEYVEIVGCPYPHFV